MRVIGLTGGIGSGKSSASERLAARGALIIDADAIVRDLQQPGQPVFEAMVERWGPSIVADDGSLDRAAVAAIVFADSDELEAINGIVHPAVRIESKRRMDEVRGTDTVVILDNPLLIETIISAEEREADDSAEEREADDSAEEREADDSAEEREANDRAEGPSPIPPHVIVVDTPTDVAVERLMEHRDFSRDDAEARIAAQVSREDRRRYADFVIDNGGDLADLDGEIERCWAWISSLPEE